MATTLYLTSGAAPVGGSGARLLSPGRGSGSANAVTTATAGGTNIPVTATAGGTALTWWFRVGAQTISGNISANLRGLESATTVNAGFGILIEQYASDGTTFLSTILSDRTVPATITEFTTSDAAKALAAVAPTSTVCNEGDWIKVTVKIRNVGTMAAGTATLSYNGPTAAQAGDSYVTFADNLVLYGSSVLSPPDRIGFYTPTIGYASNVATKTTPSFNVKAGDLITVMALVADSGTTIPAPTATGGSITWSLQSSYVTAQYGNVYFYTGAVGADATGITVSVAASGTDPWSFGATVWRNHGGLGSVAKGTGSSGGPTVTLPLTSAHSAVVSGNTDWTAADGSSRVWRSINGTAESENVYYRGTSVYGAYDGYALDTGTQLSVTPGQSTPATQKYQIIAAEVLGTIRNGTFVGTNGGSVAARGGNGSLTGTGGTNGALAGFNPGDVTVRGGQGTFTGTRLLAEYGFNEGSGTTATDSSGNSRTLTSSSTNRWQATGHTGGGGGNSWSRTGLSASALNTWTAMFWVLKSGTWTDWQSFLTDDGAFYIEADSAGVVDMFANGIVVTPGITLSNGTWAHITVVSTNGSAQFYKDGVAVGSPVSITTATIPFDTYLLYVCGGASVGGGSTVTIDDFRFFNSALGLTDINSYKNTPVTSGGSNGALAGANPGDISVRGGNGTFSAVQNATFVGTNGGSVAARGGNGTLTGSSSSGTTYHLFDGTSPDTTSYGDNTPVNLGVEFYPNSDRWVTKVGWFQPIQSGPSTDQIVSLFSVATGTEIARATATGTPTQGAWNWVSLASPVKVNAATYYKAVVWHSNEYAANSHYFDTGVYSSGNVTVGDIQIPNFVNAHSPGQGTYGYSPSLGYPDSAFNNTNYWTDIEFTDTDPSGGGTNGALTGFNPSSLAVRGGQGTFVSTSNGTLAGTNPGSAAVRGGQGVFTGVQNGTLTGASTGSVSVRGGAGAFSSSSAAVLAGTNPGSIAARGGVGTFTSTQAATLVGSNPGSLSVRGGQGTFTATRSGTFVGTNPGSTAVRGAAGSFSTSGNAALVSTGPGSVSVRGGNGTFVGVRHGTLTGTNPGSTSVRGAQGAFTNTVSGTLIGGNPGSQGVRGGNGSFVSVQNGILSGSAGSVAVRGGQGGFLASGNAVFVGANPSSLGVRGGQGVFSGISNGTLQGTRPSFVGVSGRQGAFSTTGSAVFISTGPGSIAVRGGRGSFSGTGADNSDGNATAVVLPVPVYARVLDYAPTAKALPVPVVAYVGRP